MPSQVTLTFDLEPIFMNTHKANSIAKSIGKGVEYMDQWIDPHHQLPIARSLEGIGLIAKYVEDRVDGLACLQLRCEPDGLQVLPGLVLVLDQSGIEHRFEV
jgi:hypothetical protein